QIEERRARRDQRGRPAVQPVQFGDIDALAIETEHPGEGRQQETGDDDAPAVVADRGFVDRGVSGGVQNRSSYTVFSPSWPGEVVCLAQTTYTCLRSRPSTSWHQREGEDVDARVNLARRRASRFCPGMTTRTTRSKRKLLRRRPNCQQMSSGRQLRRIVEEPLAKNLVAAPFLQRDFVEPRRLAGMIGKLEHPVDGDT